MFARASRSRPCERTFRMGSRCSHRLETRSRRYRSSVVWVRSQSGAFALRLPGTRIPINAEVATAAVGLSSGDTLRVEILALSPRTGDVIEQGLQILRSIRKAR